MSPAWGGFTPPREVGGVCRVNSAFRRAFVVGPVELRSNCVASCVSLAGFIKAVRRIIIWSENFSYAYLF